LVGVIDDTHVEVKASVDVDNDDDGMDFEVGDDGGHGDDPLGMSDEEVELKPEPFLEEIPIRKSTRSCVAIEGKTPQLVLEKLKPSDSAKYGNTLIYLVYIQN
jgi:hypothetical protein